MFGLLIGAAALVVWAGAAGAGLTPAQKCEKTKNKAAAKRALCVATQRGKEIAGKEFDYGSCSTKMADAFATAEDRAVGSCPTSGDAGDIDARIDSVFNPSTGIPKGLSGTRFVDNGDGTVSDTQTGLQWEKKDSLDSGTNYGDPHDADNTYAWTTTGSAPDGAAFTDFLNRLNNCSYDGSAYSGGFAGHCDWRLPTLAELQTILDLTASGCGSGSPCIAAIFADTRASFHQSSTSGAGPSGVWQLSFSNGALLNNSKLNPVFVRAVRGGL